MSASAKSIGSPPRFWLTEVKGCVAVDWRGGGDGGFGQPNFSQLIHGMSAL